MRTALVLLILVCYTLSSLPAQHTDIQNNNQSISLNILSTQRASPAIGLKSTILPDGSVTAYGVQGISIATQGDTPSIYGGLFSAQSNSGFATSGYGVYASAQGAIHNWAGYFQEGNVYIANDLELPRVFGQSRTTIFSPLVSSYPIRIDSASHRLVSIEDGHVGISYLDFVYAPSSSLVRDLDDHFLELQSPFTQSATASASLDLPDGAKIKEVKISMSDTNPNSNNSYELVAVRRCTGEEAILGTFAAINSTLPDFSCITFTSVQPHVVHNSVYFYLLRAIMVNDSAISSATIYYKY